MVSTLNNTVVSSRVRLARNFENVPFPRKLDDERAFDIVMKYSEMASKNIANCKFFPIGKLSELDKMALVERHLISPVLVDKNKYGAVIISDDEKLSIMVNEEDHIRAQSILNGLQLKEAYAKVDKFDNELAKLYPLSYNNQLGFLTSCPTNLGTGMRASVMMFLPALTMNGGIEQIINDAKRFNITVRGAYGEGSKSYGYMYQISNSKSLGVTENEIITNVKDFVEQVAIIENSARQKLYELEGMKLIDKVHRSYGILANAYTITSTEFVGLVSSVKLGLSLNIIKLKNEKILDLLVTNVQPANLCKINNRSLSPYERDIERAKISRKMLKNQLMED